MSHPPPLLFYHYSYIHKYFCIIFYSALRLYLVHFFIFIFFFLFSFISLLLVTFYYVTQFIIMLKRNNTYLICNDPIINRYIRNLKRKEISLDKVHIGKMGRMVELNLSLELAWLMANHSYLTCI